MYEQFRNQLTAQLYGHLPDDLISKVLLSLDYVAKDWKFSKEENSLTIPLDAAMESVREYVYAKMAQGCKVESCRNSLYTLRQFFDSVQKSPENVNARDVRTWLAMYASQHQISPVSMDKKRQMLSAYFKWMSDEGYIDKSPMLTISRIRSRPKQQKWMTSEEVAKIRWAEGLTPRQHALIELLNSTACRIGEVAGMQWFDMDFNTKSILVKGKGDKYRTVYLTDSAVLALKAYLESRNDCNPYVFVTDRKPHRNMTTRALSNDLEKALESQGITGVTPHTFRRTTATRMLQAGTDVTVVQKMLGHASVATTMIYAQQAQDVVQQAHKRYMT